MEEMLDDGDDINLFEELQLAAREARESLVLIEVSRSFRDLDTWIRVSAQLISKLLRKLRDRCHDVVRAENLTKEQGLVLVEVMMMLETHLLVKQCMQDHTPRNEATFVMNPSRHEVPDRFMRIISVVNSIAHFSDPYEIIRGCVAFEMQNRDLAIQDSETALERTYVPLRVDHYMVNLINVLWLIKTCHCALLIIIGEDDLDDESLVEV